MLKSLRTRLARKIIPPIVSWGLSVIKEEKVRFNYYEMRRLIFNFSHQGEDQIIYHFFRGRTEPGVYLDVGAHDHARLSSTLLLYKKGWRGVNIEMDPKKIRSFKKYRPDDDNIVAGISATPGKYIMYHFKYTEMDCMVPADDPVPHPEGLEPVGQEPIETRTLNDVLSESSLNGKKIQYLNIDCEGMDLEIIQTLDLSIYEPELISIEFHDDETYAGFESYMKQYGYEQYCLCHFTAFFYKASENK